MGFFKKIFKPNIPSTPTITGRELVSSTSSEEPDSPQMGIDGVNKKKKGLSSLLVKSENIYKGGV